MGSGKFLFAVRKIAQGEQRFSVCTALHAEYAGRIRMIFRPPEIIRRIICVQRGILHISFAQAVEKSVERTFCQCPVQCTGFAPFVQLTQLVAHEIQLFTRMRKHIQIHHTRLRILVAFVRAPHFLHDCRLAVHNLVVRERQQVVLVGKIVHRPEQLAMVART